MNRKISVGKTYRHFKGTNYKVLCIAQDSENLEKLVVYENVEEGKIWVRPYDMFNSLVDKNKYPDVKQKYRFELIKNKRKDDINGKNN